MLLWFSPQKPSHLHEKDHHELERSSALLGLGLSVFSVQVAHAGSYENPQQGGSTGRPTTSLDCAAPRAVLQPNGTYQAQYQTFQADPGPDSYGVRSLTTIYEWKWIPDGTPQNDPEPPPLRDVTMNYTISGGPLEAITSNPYYARASVSASCYAQYTSGGMNTLAWSDIANTATRHQSETVPAPTGTRTVVVPHYGERSVIRVDGSYLRFVNTTAVQSSGNCTVYEFSGATSQVLLRNLAIQVGSVSIQP